MKTIELRSEDHPEANGRKAKQGEQQWILTILLDNGDTLKLRLGKKGRDLLFGMMVAEETEDEIQARESLENLKTEEEAEEDEE